MGIEQGSISARLGRLPLRLGDVELSVRCLFVDAPRSAFILGRADVLDRFVLVIDQPNALILLTETAS
jgi:hypothetical protein